MKDEVEWADPDLLAQVTEAMSNCEDNAMGCDDRDFQVDFPTVWAGTSPKGKVVFRVVRPIPQPGEGVIS